MPSRETKKLPIAGMTTIVAAAAALVFIREAPYLATRPGQQQNITYELPSLMQVDARLWQDPFEAIDSFELKQGAHVRFDADSERDIAASRHTVDGGVLSGVLLRTPVPNGFGWERYGRRFEELKSKISYLSEHPDTTRPLSILAVTISGTPSVGGEEARRRARYAVVSALGAENFAPNDDEHIGYVVLHYDTNGGLVSGHGAAESDQGISIRLPFEVFETIQSDEPRHSGGGQPHHVLVLWIDDRALSTVTHGHDNWLKRVGTLITALADCSRANPVPKCPTRIIGPSSSDQYAALRGDPDAKDDEKYVNPGGQLVVLSPMVTSNIESSRIKGVAGGSEDYADVIPTIPTDDFVIGRLIDELKARHIELCEHNGIVLLSEWDTEYGRRAAETLEQAVSANCTRAGHKLPSNQQFVGVDSFLRGLDGALLGSSPNASPAQTPVKPSGTTNPTTPVEWPETADQRDYVRRLGEQIADHEREQGQHIHAIGIMASDAHDKLLLLQALRQRFPDLPFFTTDADARLFHPAVQEWTRNLIVVSGYGLSLRDSLQPTTPPFRDVYQTSTYLATLLALDNGSTLKELKSRVREWTQRAEFFEVGKTGLIRLTPPPQPLTEAAKKLPGNNGEGKGAGGPDNDVNCSVANLGACRNLVDDGDPYKLKSMQRAALLIVAAALIVAIAAFAVRQFREMTRSDPSKVRSGELGWLASFLLSLLGLSLLITLFVACVAAGVPILYFSSLEPGVLTQGVSSAPVALFWSIAISVTFLCLFLIVATIQSRFATLEEEYLGVHADDGGVPATDARRSFICWIWSELSHSTAAQHWGTQVGSFADTWALYKHHSFSPARPLRITVWWAMMMIPILLIQPWLPEVTFPIRGGMHYLFQFLTPLGFALLVVLIAVVADIVLLCCIFVIAVGRRRNSYPPKVVDAAVLRYELLPELRENVDCLLDTELIAARTAMVARSLYYPFVVMAILALGFFATIEHWARWPGRFVVIGVSICALGALWVLLRVSAERARSTALEELETAKLRALRRFVKMPSQRSAIMRQCTLLAEHISTVRQGAYAPLQEQPIVRALLLPVGGAGAAQIWEYFSTHFM